MFSSLFLLYKVFSSSRRKGLYFYSGSRKNIFLAISLHGAKTNAVKKCTVLPSPTQEKNIRRQKEKKIKISYYEGAGKEPEIWDVGRKMGESSESSGWQRWGWGSDTTVFPGPKIHPRKRAGGFLFFFSPQILDLFPWRARKIEFLAKTQVRRRKKIHVMLQDEEFGHPPSSSSSALLSAAFLLFKNHHPHTTKRSPKAKPRLN